jgi:hypothetical protein
MSGSGLTNDHQGVLHVGQPIYKANEFTGSGNIQNITNDYKGALYVGESAYKPNDFSGASNILFNNNDSLIHPQEHGSSEMHLAKEISVTAAVGMKGKDILRVIAYLLLNIAQIVMISVSLGMNWIDYCYWSFSLFEPHKIIANDRSAGDDADTIEDFYNDVCGENSNFFPECPDLCDGVNKMKNAGKVIYGLYIPSIIFYFIVCLIFLLNIKKRFSKNQKIILLVMTFLPFILFLSGFIAYYRVIDPDNNLQETKRKEIKSGPKPSNFEWNTGLFLSIPIFILEFLTILSIHELIFKFRSY